MDNKPVGIQIIAFGHFILALPWLILGIWLFMATADLSRLSLFGANIGTEIAKYAIVAAILTTAVGAAYVVTGWGLWNLKNWARAAAITIAGLTLVGQIATMVSLPFGFSALGGPTLVYVVIEAALIYYLLLPPTARLFEGQVTVPAGTTCPHCFQPGILPGMTVCPHCGRPLVITEPPLPPPPPELTRIAPSQSPVMAWLVVKAGPGAGQRLDLYEDTEIGRDPQRCQIVLDDEYVSRSHARVKLENGQFFLYDLGSKGGTFVNNRPIQKLMLYDGAVIRLGQTTLEFKRIAAGK